MSRCFECGCEMVRDYKCPHDCDWCKDCDPEEEEEQVEMNEDELSDLILRIPICPSTGTRLHGDIIKTILAKARVVVKL